jgi:hypothetical protein
MATWKKAPAELAARFGAALPVLADVERPKMFGCPAAFVSGNRFDTATSSPACTRTG